MSKIESIDEYLTTAEIAQKTRTSQSYWEKLRVGGGGPRYRMCGRFVRYLWLVVAEYIEFKTCWSTSDNQEEAVRSQQAEGVEDNRRPDDQRDDDQNIRDEGAESAEAGNEV